MSGMDGATAGYVNGTSNINDFDKGINVAAGKLVLDSNVASNTAVANIWGGPTTQLTLAGGKLEIRGDTDTGVRALDVWNNTVTIRNGSSEIALAPNARRDHPHPRRGRLHHDPGDGRHRELCHSRQHRRHQLPLDL